MGIPTRLLFDLETDGLLDTVTKIHCGTVYDLDTDAMDTYGPHDIAALIERIESADVLAGHYICGFDMLVLEKLHGIDPRDFRYLDTKVMSQALFPGTHSNSPLVGLDIAFRKKHGEDALPKELVGSHKLKAWSLRLRLGDQGKLDYTGGWENCSAEMIEYNKNDVIANVHLLRHFLKKGSVPVAVHEQESLLTYYLTKQEQYGVGFNEKDAAGLMADLVTRRAELEVELAKVFPPIEVPNGPPKVAKSNRNGRKIGETYQLYKTQAFNPASMRQIGTRLIDKYGWEPQSFAPNGQPTVTDEVLNDLPWPEAKMLAEYQGIKRVLGYLVEGKQAWLTLVTDGRIHGHVVPTGASSTRAAHSKPNLAQVPSHGKPFGNECRALFRATPGRVLVGADASSLQLAIYAHFVARYDGGVLADLCVNGDPHEYMRQASGLYYRKNQKTTTYAKWFGAGAFKLGTIALFDWTAAFEEGLTTEPPPPLSRVPKLGKLIDERMAKNMKGYADMAVDCAKAAERGFVRLLDGREVECGEARKVLVMLLQGNEAAIMKRAYILAMERLRYMVQADAAHPVLWIHDEFQWECDRVVADDVGRTLVECITQAGADLGLRLRLSGEYKIGATWKETH